MTKGTLLLCAMMTFATQMLAQGPKTKFINAQDSRIKYMGRTSIANPSCVQFTYPGVSLVAKFTGTSVGIKAKQGSGYFMVEIDDHKAFKILVGDNDSIMTLAEALPNGEHDLKLMYAQEGYEQRPAIMGIYIDNDAKLEQATLPQRAIEFVGNSITCGYGVEAMSPNIGFSYSTENHYYTYAAITASALKAQHHAIARSGIGIYKNYGGPIGGTPGMTMPDKYELTLFTDKALTEEMERWDHNRFTPNVVCVNLGTNDTSMDRYDTKLMKIAYVKFIKHLRARYKDAKIVMLSGSMMNGQALTDCQKALDEAVKETGDGNVYRFDFSPADGKLGYGADWHPSYRQQQKMADELIPFLRNLMNW